MKRAIPFIFFCSILFMSFTYHDKNVIWLDQLDLSLMRCGWGSPRANKSITGKELKIAGTTYEHGVGTHALSSFLIDVKGKAKFFKAEVGIDDNACDKASVVFYVLGDKKILWESGLMKKGKIAKINIDISGIRKIGLLVTEGDDGGVCDHADWANASITYSGKKPEAISNEPENTDWDILTPPAPVVPRINGPRIYGVRPGSPFLYRIPATGERPMSFNVEKLPEGLQIDRAKGIISGKIDKEGRYPIALVAKNAKGESRRDFIIVVGDTLALTPPMGWNSWYIYYANVSDSLMRKSADEMIGSGMADYGYQYVNIDDCWAVKADSNDSIIGGALREENGLIKTNKKFPDMRSLTDYMHSKGLKAGVYTSPGPLTCAGYAGSYKHEKQDAETFAEWGFDFLKYDWCTYERVEPFATVENKQAPYKLMWNEVNKLNRDVIFNLCQYGMGDVWKWGGEVGHSWRTTGDLGNAANSYALPGFYLIGLSNANHWEYARPGAWNDPDYILIGYIGSGQKSVKTSLSQDEQYAYMSMWSLMAAPLFFSGDMSKLDPFTLNVLCNNEVIDIDQDMLGRQARILKNDDQGLILVKDLYDGTKAVGLFNFSKETIKEKSLADYFLWEPNRVKSTKEMVINPSDIGIEGKYKVRDVWRQEDLGTYENTFKVNVPYHGVGFLKISK